MRDVGIRGHKIAAIERDIPATDAIKVINARGLLVTSGLVEDSRLNYVGRDAAWSYS